MTISTDHEKEPSFPAYVVPNQRWTGCATAFTRTVATQIAEWTNQRAEKDPEDYYTAQWAGDNLIIANPGWPNEPVTIKPDSNWRYWVAAWISGVRAGSSWST